MKIERSYEGTNFVTGLRAIAVLLIFLIHSSGGMQELGEAYRLFFDFGKYGVPIFFVITGFTIFSQLLSGHYTLSKFLKIRISRVSIPYFPLILIIFAYINFGGEPFNLWASKLNVDGLSIENLLAHLTYLACFSVEYANTFIGTEWTLHIGIFYYLVLGYLITTNLLKDNFKSLFIVLSGSIFIAIFILYLGYAHKLESLFVHWVPFRYAWMFVLGGVGYYCRNRVNMKLTKQVQDKMSNIVILLSIVCFFVLLNLETIDGVTVLYETFFSLLNGSIFAILAFILIVFVKDSARLSVVFTNKVSIYIGRISFSFYLWHYFIIQMKVANDFTNNFILVFILNFLLTILIAHCWHKVFEVRLYEKVKGYVTRIPGKSIGQLLTRKNQDSF